MPDETKRCRACQASPPLRPFVMAFQPIIDLDLQRIDAFEALVRGTTGESAASVLREVDDQAMYAFDQACRVKAIEQASALGLDRRLNINFLPRAVYEPRACIRTTLAAARRTGFPLDLITFEIVETEEIATTSHLRAIIEEYHRHGFQIALDDFGTGYSGLARLAELGPDIIKIDRVLVAGCDGDRMRRAILRRMLALGEDLGIKIVLEGVETAGEVAALRDLGARFIQGFFFARPSISRLADDAAVFPEVHAPATVPA